MATAEMAAVPRRTPVTTPVPETVALVVSPEAHKKVTPEVTGVAPDMAVAVSCLVPARTTVESPLITTDVTV